MIEGQRRFLTAVGLAAVLMAGCGGSGGDKDENTTAGAAETSVAAHEAQRAVQRMVDNDDCDAMTASYLEEGYVASGEDPRAACQSDPTEGLRAEDYRVASSIADGDRATVVLAVEDGSERTYTVVREDDRWLVADVSTRTGIRRAEFGRSLSYLSSYEIDGEPIDARLRVTVLSMQSRRAPRYTPTRAGREWVALRARIESESSDAVQVSAQSFVAVIEDGSRFSGQSHPFEPTIGGSVADLAPGDRLTGYVSFEIPKRSRVKEVRFTAMPGLPQSAMIWDVR